jgi:aminoglycoside 6-adenylyltransferase
MMKMNPILAEMKENILKWAHEQDDIRLLVAVGSRTRSEHPGSKFSDLDLLIFTNNQEFYLSNQDWITRFGTVLFVEMAMSPGPGQPPELMVVYDNFQGVDFVLIPVGVIQHMNSEQDLPDVFLRGFDVWVDKDDVSARLSSIVDEQKHNILRPMKPSQEEFGHVVRSFLFCAYYIGRVLYQNDLWIAKIREHDLRGGFLKMMEWHARSKHNWSLDVWHMGKYLDVWAEKTVLEQLPKIYAEYAKEPSQIALEECLQLFETMASEVAEAGNYSIDTSVFEKTKLFLDSIRNDTSHTDD